MKFDISPKFAMAAVAGVVGLTLLSSCFIVVQDGTERTKKFMGEIAAETYNAGFHMVNPFASFEEWDIKEMVMTDNISIPSQDKFKSGATLSVKWSLEGADKPWLERTVGTQKDVKKKLMTVPLDSIVKDAGRNVKVAQDLFVDTVSNAVQAHIMSELQEKTSAYGIKIHEVFIGDITLPKVIQESIELTKKMEEQTAQEQATLDRQKLVYARGTAESKAKAESATHDRKAAQEKADGIAYSTKADADAQLYAQQKEAEGNIALANSVTPNLLKLKAAEVELIKASKWQGGVPSTFFGGDSKIAPLYHMNNNPVQ